MIGLRTIHEAMLQYCTAFGREPGGIIISRGDRDELIAAAHFIAALTDPTAAVSPPLQLVDEHERILGLKSFVRAVRRGTLAHCDRDGSIPGSPFRVRRPRATDLFA
jgi:hypothetical protein